MRNLYSSITAVLCCICRHVLTLTCDASLISKAGIAATGTPTVDHLQTGTTITLDASFGCGTSVTASTDMCRVTMNTTTSSRSSIYMELWLPDKWEKRYISIGNIGLAGCLFYPDLQYLSSLQLAVGGANGGYFESSADAFAGNIDIITDFSFRSVHNMTTIGKQLTKTYYNSPPNKSYYFGCSTGGRQGLQSAQMFPEDFNGIIAGSAAADFNGLVGWSGYPFAVTGREGSKTFVNQGQWSDIANAVMSACDGTDGVTDGIVEDPDLCNFDLSTIACGTGSNSQNTNCLTSDQFKTATTVLGPLRDTNNKLLYPAMQPGAEDAAFGQFYNGNPNIIPTLWYQNAIFAGQNYDPAKLNISGIVFGKKLDLASISSFEGDLSSFKERGGKLITLHGLTDALITSTNSERYYKHVSATMSLSPDDLDDFYRYFRISGMGHCGGGIGAWDVGFVGANAPLDAQYNVVFALFDWVENGNAPNALLGTKFVNDDSRNGVSFSRNHCRYPYRTTYAGGNSTLPGSWNCTAITSTNVPMEEET